MIYFYFMESATNIQETVNNTPMPDWAKWVIGLLVGSFVAYKTVELILKNLNGKEKKEDNPISTIPIKKDCCFDKFKKEIKNYDSFTKIATYIGELHEMMMSSNSAFKKELAKNFLECTEMHTLLNTWLEIEDGKLKRKLDAIDEKLQQLKNYVSQDALMDTEIAKLVNEMAEIIREFK